MLGGGEGKNAPNANSKESGVGEKTGKNDGRRDGVYCRQSNGKNHRLS